MTDSGIDPRMVEVKQALVQLIEAHKALVLSSNDILRVGPLDDHPIELGVRCAQNRTNKAAAQAALEFILTEYCSDEIEDPLLFGPFLYLDGWVCACAHEYSDDIVTITNIRQVTDFGEI